MAELSEANLSRGSFALLCLICASFLISSIFPRPLGYLAVAGSLVAVCLWLISADNLEITAPKPAVGLYALVLGLMGIGTIRNPSMGAIARLAAFMAVTSLILFLLVHVVDFTKFWRWFGLVSACLVIIASPTLFIEQMAIGPVTLTDWTTTTPIVGTNNITSIFVNPNMLGLVCAFAIVGLVTTQQLTNLTLTIVAVNAIGLIASGGRAAQAATVAGLGVYATGFVYNRYATTLVTMSALGGILYVFLALFGAVPGPELLETVSLTGRRQLWVAAADAIAKQPLLGYGATDTTAVLNQYLGESRFAGYTSHNSFFRMALSGGVFAAVAYLGLHIYSLFQSGSSSDGLASHAVLWVAVIAQLFNGSSIFGLSPSSILFAVALGWALRTVVE
ncbi:hypothetical protein EL22_25265 [Halostagnicola sp. A56]|nr:hypothetical protein EL22_25265 [Halostagnicola sp. A56]